MAYQYNECVPCFPFGLTDAGRSRGKKNSGVLIGKLDKKGSC